MCIFLLSLSYGQNSKGAFTQVVVSTCTTHPWNVEAGLEHLALYHVVHEDGTHINIMWRMRSEKKNTSDN